MTSVPVLRTDRCILSAITYEDIPMLRQILDDAETQRFLPELCEVFQTKEDLIQFITSFNNFLQQDEGILWGIYSDHSPTLMGFIAIMDMTTEPTLFYAMHPKYRNREYMKKSLGCVIEYMKKSQLCRKIMTEVYQDNIVSQKLLKGIGFHYYEQKDKKIYTQLAI